jgi:hypothetical protein
MEVKMAKKAAKAILRRGSVGLPQEHDLEYILHGRCMLDGDKPSAPDAELWAQYGKEVMQLQGVECNGGVPWHGDKKCFFDLFERPELWWRCGPGAGEPRLLLSGDRSQAMPERGLSQGMPHCFKVMNHGCAYESERDYLIRLDLLTDIERALLTTG